VLRVYLRPNAYTVSSTGSHTGLVEAEGDVLTFTSICGESSVTGTGRYRWSLEGDKLHVELIGKDECGGRTEHFDDVTYERSR